MKQWYHLYVDDVHVGTKRYEWPVSRIMRHVRKKYPDARSWEVRCAETDVSHMLLRAGVSI